MICPIPQGDNKKPQGKNIMSASAMQGSHKKDWKKKDRTTAAKHLPYPIGGRNK